MPATVTIGIPVYNGCSTVERALRSALAQTFREIRIVVSDNGSNDTSAEICRRVASEDPRVTVVEWDNNRGPHENFRWLVRNADTDFFCWLGADDEMDPDFIQATLDSLRSDDSVASCALTSWIGTGQLAHGTSPLLGNPRKNVARYLRTARDNSRFYGLYRTQILKASLPESDISAWDVAVVLGVLRFGKFQTVDRVLLRRERTNPSEYANLLAREKASWVHRALPMLDFTKWVTVEARVPISAQAVVWLAARNLYEHLRVSALNAGLYGRATRLALRLVDRVRLRLVG